MSHHLVEARSLGYAYPDGTSALSGISFLITHGESVAVIGANGAGKSTLLLHLAGCLFPSAGAVRIGDAVMTRKNLKQVRRAVGLVFADPDDQLFMPTVFEDVVFGPLNQGLSEQEAAARADEALATVGALHLKDRPPYKLSGGEKRAVSIAAVIAMSPDILVMDEPSSNLDARGRRQLIELLLSFGHTKIIATHDLDLAMDVCKRAFVLKDGKLEADGPTEEIFGNAGLLEACHLEKPFRMQPCPVCGK
jgi:cobalt/nickel transport system ATP-binding protein